MKFNERQEALFLTFVGLAARPKHDEMRRRHAALNTSAIEQRLFNQDAVSVGNSRG
jgi:hypothetical protein